MNNIFLFEMFCEELPHHVQNHVERMWTNKATTLLSNYLKDSISIKTFSTPRRVAIQIENLPLTYTRESEYRKGPKINADSSAIDAFIAKYSLKHCNKNDEFWFYQKDSEEAKIESILLELCHELAFQTTGPKMMRWSDNKNVWFRPVHSIICMLNEKVLPFSYGYIDSSNFTYGHRFICQNNEFSSIIEEKKILLSHAKDYENALEQYKVIASYQKRKDLILNQIKKICQENSFNNSFAFSINNSLISNYKL
jgi:glycyl-tRNA synthetase beta chain